MKSLTKLILILCLLSMALALAGGGSTHLLASPQVALAQEAAPVENGPGAANTGTWTLTGSMLIPRFHHTATLLDDGRVLVAGGKRSSNVSQPEYTAELYDPRTGQWASTMPMNFNRSGHDAVLLHNGKVLVN